MAETQKPSIGWGGEVWLSTDETEANLVELVHVTGFGIPEVEVDQEEATHLKSPGGYKEWMDGLRDGGTVAINLNFRPGSDTDTMIDTWQDARGPRMIQFVVPLQGVPVKSYTALVIFAGYSPGEVTPGAKMEATLSVKISGALTRAAIVPAP